MMRTLSIALFPFLLFALSGCGGSNSDEKPKPEREELLARIDSLQQEINEKSDTGKLPKKKMRELMDAYKAFPEHYPKDSLAPEQLLHAGGMARSLEEPQRAINIYRRILNEYPDFKDEATVRFLLAFTYDQDLGKKEKAKELYRAVIDSFPDHKLAEQAEEYLKVIDLSDEELMKHFEEKRKQEEGMKGEEAQKTS